MIEITNLRQGAILNHNHGIETDECLKIKINGLSSIGQPVKINGEYAKMDGRNFTASVDLEQKLNKITASVMTPYGTFSQEVILVWDKKSFRRCNFYVDDNIFVFTDLAKQRPTHAFDHFYLAGLKKIHDRYGIKITLNCFYHNDHHPFDLKDMPDIWKSEFVDNSDWLRFSFHSYGEFPDRPYIESTADEFGRDYDLVKNEIIRFAGEEAWIPPIVIHWANIHPAVAEELIARGTRCYSNSFRPRVMGGPSLAERQEGGDMNEIEKKSVSRTGLEAVTEGVRMHYDTPEEKSYMIDNRRAYYDPALGVYFFSNGCCCNLMNKETLNERHRQIFDISQQSGNEVFSVGTHEQYTFPYYPNYIPDHLERIETAARCLVEKGNCTPVFFNEGLLGNTAWEDY